MNKADILSEILHDIESLATHIKQLIASLQSDGVIPVPQEKGYSIEQLRAVLCTKAIPDAHALLQKYEVRKLSELPKERYGSFLFEAQHLPDKEAADAT